MREERTFGLSVGAVLCGLSLLFLYRGRPAGFQVSGGIGLLLLGLGSLSPGVLKWPAAAWMRFGRALGHVNALILMTVVFFVMLVPLSIVWRVSGKDPLARDRRRWQGWSPYPARFRAPDHYSRMY